MYLLNMFNIFLAHMTGISKCFFTCISDRSVFPSSCSILLLTLPFFSLLCNSLDGGCRDMLKNKNCTPPQRILMKEKNLVLFANFQDVFLKERLFNALGYELRTVRKALFPFKCIGKRQSIISTPPLKSFYQAFIFSSSPFCKLLGGAFRPEL